VTADPIQLIDSNNKFFVFNKPASIPIHPSGKFRYNTLIHILGKEQKLTSIWPCHRLDRLTSGIVIMARSSKVASEFSDQMQAGEISKEYIARVRGKFPDYADVNRPLLNVKPADKSICSDHGKSSRTVFRRVSYDSKSDSSVVHCIPYTGRTHQIRVHLQWIGHPIPNDPLYAVSFLPPLSTIEVSFGDKYRDPLCPFCKDIEVFPQGEEIWLHACVYKGKDWKYEVEPPAWAKI